MAITLHQAGRVLVVRTSRAVDGKGPDAKDIATYAASNRSIFILVDTTGAGYADSDGIRWLLRLSGLALPLRIVTRQNSRTLRTLELFGMSLNLFDCPKRAWRSPWHLNVPPN